MQELDQYCILPLLIGLLTWMRIHTSKRYKGKMVRCSSLCQHGRYDTVGFGKHSPSSEKEQHETLHEFTIGWNSAQGMQVSSFMFRRAFCSNEKAFHGVAQLTTKQG